MSVFIMFMFTVIVLGPIITNNDLTKEEKRRSVVPLAILILLLGATVLF